MVDAIKKTIRISHNGMDEEIADNIEVCRMKLTMVGVYCKNNDKLFQKACELYVKWQCDYQGKGERYEKAFYSLRDAMALCGDYNVRPAD